MSLFTSYTHLTHKPKNTPQGFTIVELLIVIVVIAILAAISIVSYNGIQNRAYDTTVQNDLSTLVKKFEIYRIDSNNDRYPIGNDQLATLGFYLGNKGAYATTPDIMYNLLNCTWDNGSSYTITATSKSGKRFYVRSSTGGSIEEYTDSTSWAGSADAICESISSGLVGNGAGYNNNEGWRAWTN